MKRLSVSDLKCQYGNKRVLKGIDLVLDQPGIYALVGPNGSGKTTLMNAVANLIPIESGKISIMGKPHTDVEVFRD